MSLSGNKKVACGEFTLSMVPTTRDGKTGVEGHLKFLPYATAPKSDKLRLLQVVRTTEPAGNDLKWTGGEARRNDAQTTANAGTGVEGGFFVDSLYANRTPRQNSTDAAVSPYYTEDYLSNPNAAGNDEDGWQKGGTDQKAALLYDFPGSGGNLKFKFETAAKGEDNGTIFGTVKWHFTVENHKVKDDDWSVENGVSATFNAAVNQFNETFHNPGASTAPQPATSPPTSAPTGPTTTPDAGVH
jgi:hypothetical protein